MSIELHINWTNRYPPGRTPREVDKFINMPNIGLVGDPRDAIATYRIDYEEQEEVSICRLLESLAETFKTDLFWQSIKIQTLYFSVELAVTRTISFGQIVGESVSERWTKGYKGFKERLLHRLLGPATGVQWFVRGEHVAPFDELLRREISWQQFFETRPYDAFVLAELHSAGLIKMDEAVFDNFRMMIEPCC